jgi:glycosyltransferase involved in cell wall biosynthesis
LSVEAYLDYIGRSRGECSVAKEAYVKTRCGWFSDRTVAYLASGKPAIVQDTGFSDVLPCGEGLFAFQTADDVVNAVETIGTDYERHCRAARRIAREYFDSDKVLRTMLQTCGLPIPR